MGDNIDEGIINGAIWIKKNYIELGKIYYEKHSMTPDEESEEACSAITNAQNAIVDLQAKIKEIKGI